MPQALVRKRCFVQMIGYEPVGVEHQHRRFIREMARFQKAWNVAAAFPRSAFPRTARSRTGRSRPEGRTGASPRTITISAGTTSCRRTRGERLVAFPARRRRLDRVHSHRHGRQIFRRGMAIWRLLSLPLIYILGMIWLSICGHAHRRRPQRPTVLLFWAPLLAFALFVALRLTFGRMLFIRYALDDWYFARDFIHRVRPGIEERLDRFARELVRLARETDADEIIVDGHSLGAPLSLVVVDRALNSIRGSAAAAGRCTSFPAARRCSRSHCIPPPAGCARPSRGWRMRRSTGWSSRHSSTSSMSTR